MGNKDIQNLDELIVACERGEKFKYHLFWGHSPKVLGCIDKSCLSNWYPSSFSVEGQTYATAEHYMMAEKAKQFGDEVIRSKILSSKSPGAAKRLGRSVSNFDEKKWLTVRMDIVVAANFAKFSQNDDLKRYLFETGNKILVEASPFDRIWGIGMTQDNSDARRPERWRGLNLLGFALMKVRSELMNVAGE